MRRFVPLLSLLILLPFAFSAPALAAKPVTTLTFTELPVQPVNGVSVGGVTFGFEVGGVSSTDAFMAGSDRGALPSCRIHRSRATPGVLTLTFDRPSTVLEFGIARSCICTLTPGVSVELFKPGATGRSRGIITQTTSPLVSFSEGLFSYSGPAIQTAVVTFPSAGIAPRFALDNLTFH